MSFADEVEQAPRSSNVKSVLPVQHSNGSSSHHKPISNGSSHPPFSSNGSSHHYSSLNGGKKDLNNGSPGRMSVGSSAVCIGPKPTLIEAKPMRFLVMDAPRQSNLHVYIKEMRRYHVTDVVRVCEPTYHGAELCAAGIGLHEMEYKDGTSPSKELIETWLQLVERTFYVGGGGSSSGGGGGSAVDSNSCIAVHCVAGLGRAPVMVAIAMIEFLDMDPVEAVSFIRQRRRGAINEKQLLYLEGYKKQYKKKGGGAHSDCCVIL